MSVCCKPPVTLHVTLVGNGPNGSRTLENKGYELNQISSIMSTPTRTYMVTRVVLGASPWQQSPMPILPDICLSKQNRTRQQKNSWSREDIFVAVHQCHPVQLINYRRVLLKFYPNCALSSPRSLTHYHQPMLYTSALCLN